MRTGFNAKPMGMIESPEGIPDFVWGQMTLVKESDGSLTMIADCATDLSGKRGPGSKFFTARANLPTDTLSRADLDSWVIPSLRDAAMAGLRKAVAEGRETSLAGPLPGAC